MIRCRLVLTVTADTFVPDEYEAVLIDKLADENIMRGLTTIITSANGDKKDSGSCISR